ncbi:hypothetical protein PENCOP_c014G02962 [Penicillium coprophilum]|uniref:Uncharacterized protein n=1 Tax=Penicillium coprophilum TaxID=36646 RepID=A0A1V6U9V5_9EURO|nr:hypothetical protein PENCOP_c014G02962 [Penicillium coprophilum]
MRLHLVISRHGLPVTRILWTTTSSNSVLGEYGTHRPASTAAVASSRTPNIAFSNGGYTVAQLLEDVNEVVPLETEPSVFDAEFSGQWGLEDYVVEVAGSECLHFMEVDGLLRDGDEVVIRALQLADLRTRRLCGRHQITADGKHLIDGVPFGSPFLKRTTSTRPAITIPPRKKRRTVFSGWEHAGDFVPEEVHADEEGDGEWLPPSNTGFGKELSIMPAEHEESLGTVIRHPVDHTAESDSEADMSEMPGVEDELESELQALKEDFEEASQFVDIRNQTQNASGHPLRATSIVKRPTSKGSLAAASSLSSKRSRAEDSSPRASKAVRFNKGHEQKDDDMRDLPQPPQAPQVEESVAETSDSDSSDSSASSSDSDSDDDSDDGDSSSEVEPAAEAPSDSDSDTDSSSSSEDSDSSDSDSEEETAPPVKKVQQPVSVGPPGEGSIRTKKSNNRIKLRRRLSKLKELGALPQQAGFDALREWEDKHGGWHTPENHTKPESFVKPQLPVGTQALVEPEQESTGSSIKRQKREKKEQEKKEFEARRAKLLRDLASGNGVDVGETSEKENVPPAASAAEETLVSEEVPGEDQLEQEPSNRRTLDIASSRRMLFGSLGMRTPKTKEEEETTRRKLAAKASAFGRRNKPSSQETQEETDQMQEDEDASDIDWQNKLVIRAVECLYPQVDMTAPPYPFVQRWDQEANASIRELKGPNKKRKRKQRVQVYEEYEEQAEYDENGNYYGYDDQYQGGYDQANHEGHYEGEADPHYEGHWEGEAAPYYEGHYAGEAEGEQINYDDAPEPEQFDDLPSVPIDISSVPDLTESEVKVGAIIAFRQLDMSKATNWQPQMSEYRVAEVRSVKDHGVINVLLAKRDRKPTSASGEDELRQFSKFEVPDLANDEGEDDGYRELAFAELSDPKLLQPTVQSGAEAEDQDNTREGSIVSVVHESVPNAQPALSEEMCLDDTTFVTIGNEVSRLESRSESPGMPDEPIQQTPGRGIPQIQVQTGSNGRSVTPPIPSPSFNGFHSARSWQQMTPGAELSCELEGHTLIGGETPSASANRDEDPSALSYASANQSFADEPEDQEMSDHQEHDRQVVSENLIPPGDSGDSGPQSGSLLSTIDRNGNGGASDSLFVERDTLKEKHSATPNSSSESWRDLLNRLRNGPSEPSESLVTSEGNISEDHNSEDHNSEGNQSPQRLEDSLQHSYLDLNFSPLDSPRASNSRSPIPPMSAQKDAQSQKQASFPSPLETKSPAASTRSKLSQRVLESTPTSEIPASQASEVIDLTSSPRGSPEPSTSNMNPSQRSKSALYGDSRENTPRSAGRPSKVSTGKLQRMVEVSISPSSQKKRRSSRKF